MDYSKTIIVIFTFLIFICTVCLADEEKGHYEANEKACEKCSCRGIQATNKAKYEYYELNCSARNLKSILAGWPEEFGNNHTGSEIVVSYSGNPIGQLYQLPETEAIVSFSCRHCNITEISSAIFMDVVNIRRADLSWNLITGDQLQADIFRGRYKNREYAPIPLEDLDLSHNLVHSFDKRLFEHTPHLKKLVLSNNQMNLIDRPTAFALSSVKELTHLDLSFNQLSDLPDNIFDQLQKLQELHLEGNALKTIPTSLTPLGGSLKSLYIGVNPLEWITADSLIGFKKLTLLNMSSMPELKAVKSGTFAHLKALEVLVVSNSPKLELFDAESLKEASGLQELDVSNCNLKQFNLDYRFEMTIENTTTYWKSLHTLRLSDNPWHCDCFMAHTLAGIYRYNNASRYTDYKARCSTPYELAGTLLDDLSIQRGCQLPAMNMQVIVINPPLDTHPFLRPKAIIMTVVAGLVVLGLAFIVGFGIVMVRRRLRKDRSLFATPIRYTTVRSSTMSTLSTVNVE